MTMELQVRIYYNIGKIERRKQKLNRSLASLSSGNTISYYSKRKKGFTDLIAIKNKGEIFLKSSDFHWLLF